MKARILVVDDDAALAEMIGIVLSSEDFEPVFCYDGSAAEETFRSVAPDLVLLDLMLPGMDGIQVCQTIRETSDIPIVMLTAKSDTADVVRGLEAGADDYVPKPFKPAELVARVKARLRPIERGATQEITLGDVVIDVTGHSVTREGEQISLTPLEFDLLTTLAKSPNQVFSRDELLRDVWGYPHAADNRLVNVHVQRLRSKVERDPENPELVLTVRGIGYKAGGHSHR
ncbi:response regulator transcription factor [Kocuria sp. cx-455]|uniref:MtrAB system response regulator MtrA n=1 Tax=unclassified Candidatus Sulfotelmatobacter TaxID=2635724 RepID=UPI00168597B7|nr:MULTISPECIES: MtrAB system response regulator MtrA [unclassified Candidatus Sulfotelmatobacter]MBD2761026.1 response regulator transcription factor [Kocuria sp. cx-116]MBD2764614.1 response regulator transcription factor [Kocuria sp. cx-455]